MKILSWRSMAERSTLSISTLKREAKRDPQFPRKIQITPNRVGFAEDDFIAWLDSKREGASLAAE